MDSSTKSSTGKTRIAAQSTAKKRQRRRRGYRGLTADELHKQREARLIAAGIELFGERGYAATSIEKLCSHAQVSTRHFYEQFGGREAALHAVHDALVEQMQQIIQRQLTETDTPLERRITDTIEAIALFMLEQPSRGRILCIESVGVSTAMEARRRETTHQLAEIISRYAYFMARRQALPERDYHLPSIALVGMFNELIVEWLTGDTGLSPSEMAREAKILFRAMIFGARHYEEGSGRLPDAPASS